MSIGGGGTLQMVGPGPNSFDFSAAAVEDDVLTGGSSSGQTTVNDVLYDGYTGTTIDISGHVIATPLINRTNFSQAMTFTSLDPSIGTVDSTGKVTRVGMGTCRIRISAGNLIRQVNVPCDHLTNQSSLTFNKWVTGSLAAHVQSQVDTLASVAAANSYVVFNPSDMTFQAARTRRSDCWAFPVDLTWFTTWRSQYGTYPANASGKATLALITTKHAIGINHNAMPADGSVTVNFISADGTQVTRTLMSAIFYPAVIPKQSDGEDGFQVYTLDSDVPNTALDGAAANKSINPCQVMPANWTSHFGALPLWAGQPPTGGFANGYALPVLAINQHKEARIGALSQVRSIYPALSWFGGQYYPICALDAWSTLERAASPSYSPIPGDSGSPVGFLINGKFVYISTVEGFNIANWAAAINADLATHNDTLGHPYVLSSPDLSSFPSY